ncbi:MAG TPA: toll/interleukin-1 receptor domain-containing protein, partial [Ktedonobacteraceae bacterium]|nr:toll/interleukin-1 receptor domain-containing protein [Ktedonobacteraceae bacterium]
MNVVSLIEECDPMASLSPPPLSVYYCYDLVDLAFCRVLDVHLGPLKRNGWIHTWDDQQIPAGTEWEREREAYLHTAHLLVLLVSADFLASESGVHMMQVALQRHQVGEAIAIPILVRAANWEETDLQTLQVLPREQKAITTWPDQDNIWREVTREIQRVVEAMRQWVFVAYSPEDQAFVEQLHQDMAPRGVLLWSPEKRKNTRDLSQDETRNAMRAASAVILIASPDVPTSRLVKAQLALAADYQRPILVIWARGEDWKASNPGNWRVQEVVDARGGRYEAARATVLMRLRQEVAL